MSWTTGAQAPTFPEDRAGEPGGPGTCWAGGQTNPLLKLHGTHPPQTSCPASPLPQAVPCFPAALTSLAQGEAEGRP